MNDDQQDTILADGEDNVMERALGTFDALYDNAIAFIIDTTGNAGRAGAEILRKFGNLSAGDIAEGASDAATSWGETAADMATAISGAVVDRLAALTRLAAELFGS